MVHCCEPKRRCGEAAGRKICLREDGSVSAKIAPQWADFAIAASAAQLQPNSSTGQHHGQRRSQCQVVCQRQQRSDASSFQRGQLNSKGPWRAARPRPAGALDADGLHWGSMHGLEQLQRPRAVHQGQHGQLGLHVAHVARAGLYRESCCATNDERREPMATRATAPGGFFCVPSVRAATRAEAGAPIG